LGVSKFKNKKENYKNIPNKFQKWNKPMKFKSNFYLSINKKTLTQILIVQKDVKAIVTIKTSQVRKNNATNKKVLLHK